MIITEIQYFFSKIIRFQAIFKDTVEFTCALEFKISSQLTLGAKGLSPHELAHKWVKDLLTRPDMSIKVG